jgi:hypothetical protein
MPYNFRNVIPYFKMKEYETGLESHCIPVAIVDVKNKRAILAFRILHLGKSPPMKPPRGGRNFTGPARHSGMED